MFSLFLLFRHWINMAKSEMYEKVLQETFKNDTGNIFLEIGVFYWVPAGNNQQ